MGAHGLAPKTYCRMKKEYDLISRRHSIAIQCYKSIKRGKSIIFISLQIHIFMRFKILLHGTASSPRDGKKPFCSFNAYGFRASTMQWPTLLGAFRERPRSVRMMLLRFPPLPKVNDRCELPVQRLLHRNRRQQL